jgi:hypothetical protein
MEQTKGYLRLKGKILFLDKATNRGNSAKNNLSFAIKTSHDNTVPVQIGDWINSKLNVKVKNSEMEKALEYPEQDAVSSIQDLFKDGDSVYINCRVEVDTYYKKPIYIVSAIYSEKEDINFDSDTFEEVNELVMPIIISEKRTKESVQAGITNYVGDMINIDLKLNDEVISQFFTENIKVGDLVPCTITVRHTPNYTDEETTSTSTATRTTLKGKTIGGNTNSGSKYRKYDGYIDYLEVADVDNTKITSKKYTRAEIAEAIEATETKLERIAIESENKKSNSSEEDDDLPF